tara:strand:- start:837 stop:1670 length:834 start_codon:yes stop_codon:yes gene_type:complete
MSYPIDYPTPQGANIQIFTTGGTASNSGTTSDWVKPQGASFIWVTLIGAGGAGGDGSSTVGAGGGGSGAVTNYMGPAFLIPDVLRVTVGATGVSGGVGGAASTLVYQAKDGTGYTLLSANGGNSGTAGTAGATGGAASTSNYFSCMGFFQSVAGQDGAAGSGTGAGGDQTNSNTTFLSGGAGGAGAAANVGGAVTANYGLVIPNTTAGGTVRGANGFFQRQPIVGLGGAGGTTSTTSGTAGGRGAIGCGGGGAGEDAVASGFAGGLGGDGMVVIITW